MYHEETLCGIPQVCCESSLWGIPQVCCEGTLYGTPFVCFVRARSAARSTSSRLGLRQCAKLHACIAIDYTPGGTCHKGNARAENISAELRRVAVKTRNMSTQKQIRALTAPPSIHVEGVLPLHTNKEMQSQKRCQDLCTDTMTEDIRGSSFFIKLLESANTALATISLPVPAIQSQIHESLHNVCAQTLRTCKPPSGSTCLSRKWPRMPQAAPLNGLSHHQRPLTHVSSSYDNFDRSTCAPRAATRYRHNRILLAGTEKITHANTNPRTPGAPSRRTRSHVV